MNVLLFSEGKTQIYGNCRKGYEPVKDAFIQNFVSGQELNASICIYVKQKCVVDLHGTSIDDHSYTADHLQVRYFPLFIRLFLKAIFIASLIFRIINSDGFFNLSIAARV